MNSQPPTFSITLKRKADPSSINTRETKVAKLLLYEDVTCKITKSESGFSIIVEQNQETRSPPLSNDSSSSCSSSESVVRPHTPMLDEYLDNYGTLVLGPTNFSPRAREEDSDPTFPRYLPVSEGYRCTSPVYSEEADESTQVVNALAAEDYYPTKLGHCNCCRSSHTGRMCVGSYIGSMLCSDCPTQWSPDSILKRLFAAGIINVGQQLFIKPGQDILATGIFTVDFKQGEDIRDDIYLVDKATKLKYYCPVEWAALYLPHTMLTKTCNNIFVRNEGKFRSLAWLYKVANIPETPRLFPSSPVY